MIAQFHILTVVTVKSTISWDMMPFNLVEIHQHFIVTRCLLLQPWKWGSKFLQNFDYFFQTTWHHIPEDTILSQWVRLKSTELIYRKCLNATCRTKCFSYLIFRKEKQCCRTVVLVRQYLWQQERKRVHINFEVFFGICVWCSFTHCIVKTHYRYCSQKEMSHIWLNIHRIKKTFQIKIVYLGEVYILCHLPILCAMSLFFFKKILVCFELHVILGLY
jgi:hypothetical protein